MSQKSMTILATVNGQAKPILYIPSPLHPDAYTRAEELGFDTLLPTDPRSKKWYLHADAVCLRQGTLSGGKEALLQAKRLRIVARNGTGYETVDTETCQQMGQQSCLYDAKHLFLHLAESGIAVTSLPGFNAEAVAEHTLALTLAVSRRLCETSYKIRTGGSLRSIDYMAHSLNRKTVGLIGQGAIARETALKFIGAFNCKILVYSPSSPADRWTGSAAIPHRRCDSLEEMLPSCDVVSLHCPLLPETHKMVDERFLARMKPSAVLINCGRGALVDDAALYSALKAHAIFGAGLDVTAHEPANLHVYPDLLLLDNIVVTPHIGATTIEVTRDSTIRAVENCYEYLTGQLDKIENRVV
ncbi:MAG: hypothetical protein L7F78_10040 [Syntrophales bacterium LBB04]|nr:hypothetical protein [Syntrophales bacterium LBB04]